MEIISSRQNPTILKICRLTEKKNREADKLFRFDGIKLYAEAAAAGVEIDTVLIRESTAAAIRKRFIDMNAPLPEKTGARVIFVTDRLFDSVSEEKSPEGIITVAKYIDKSHKTVTIDNNSDGRKDILPKAGEKIIMLEDIRDPGNLGTVIRSASALGIGTVILCGDCADIYSPKTLRGAMGAIFRIKTIACRDGESYARALRSSGRRVFAAALRRDSKSLCDFRLRFDDCIAIGNEGHGLSAGLIDACDASIIIPMSEGSESLNAAAAATIFMWELSKL